MDNDDLIARLRQLHAESRGWSEYEEYEMKIIGEAAAALERMRENDRRYRWLRDKANYVGWTPAAPMAFMCGTGVALCWTSALYGEKLDAAIDAAIDAEAIRAALGGKIRD